MNVFNACDNDNWQLQDFSEVSTKVHGVASLTCFLQHRMCREGVHTMRPETCAHFQMSSAPEVYETALKVGN